MPGFVYILNASPQKDRWLIDSTKGLVMEIENSSKVIVNKHLLQARLIP